MKQINSNQRLLEAIDRVLTKHPEGLREYDLMTLLDEQYPTLFPKPDLSDKLLLFQHHFFLKHSLYLLQQQYCALGEAQLDIGTLLITKRPTAARQQTAITEHDPLRDYYLDLSNLNKETSASVDELIHGFWQAMEKYYQQPEALETLGLTGQEPYAEQKRRYQRLVQTNHPDKGGDEASFRRIQDAWEAIKPKK